MFDLGSVEERNVIPIPMGHPSDSGIGVSGWFMKEVKAHNPTDKAGWSVEFAFEYRGERTTNGVPHKGAKFSHREFDPMFQVEDPNALTDKDKTRIEGVQRRIKHILGRFIEAEKIDKIKTPTFEALVKLLVDRLPQYIANVECTLKLVYNGKYAAFPLYPDFISTEFSPKMFKYDPQYDKLDRQEPRPSAAPTGGSDMVEAQAFAGGDDSQAVVAEGDDDNPF